TDPLKVNHYKKSLVNLLGNSNKLSSWNLRGSTSMYSQEDGYIVLDRGSEITAPYIYVMKEFKEGNYLVIADVYTPNSSFELRIGNGTDMLNHSTLRKFYSPLATRFLIVEQVYLDGSHNVSIGNPSAGKVEI